MWFESIASSSTLILVFRNARYKYFQLFKIGTFLVFIQQYSDFEQF